MEPDGLHKVFMPLPRAYSVVIYYRDSTNNYVLEVLKKKGYDLGYYHLPKGILGVNLNKEEVEQMRSTGIPIDLLEAHNGLHLTFGATEFVKLLERNPYFEKLLIDVRRSARMPDREEILNLPA